MQIVNSYRILHLHLYLEASWHKGYLALKSENQLTFHNAKCWIIMNAYCLVDKYHYINNSIRWIIYKHFNEMYDYIIVFPSLFCLSVINNFLEELFIMVPIMNTLNGTPVTALFSYP